MFCNVRDNFKLEIMKETFMFCKCVRMMSITIALCMNIKPDNAEILQRVK